MVVKGDKEDGSSQQDEASLKDRIFEQLKGGLQSLRDMNDVTNEDLLRMYHDQISRMLITEKVHSALISDPFQHLKENISDNIMSKIIDCIDVVSHHSVTTMDGYVRTEAIVRLSSKDLHDVVTNKKRPRKGVNCLCEFLELQFTYLRTSMLMDASTISYNIDILRRTSDITPTPLLWITIFAASNVPSSVAVNMCDNSNADDQWSDIDNDSTDHTSNDSVCYKQVQSGRNIDIENDTMPKGDVNCLDNTREITSHNVDRYEAGIDLCVMEQIVQFFQQPYISSSGDINTEYDDATIFFFLMTFPFYEHEWDVVGYLLKSLFDGDVE